MTLPRAIIRKMDSIIFIFAHVFLLSFPHSLHSTKKFSCTTFSAFYFLYFYFFTWRDGDDDEGTEMRKNWNNFYITKHDVKYFPFLSLHCLLLFHFIICTIYTSCSSCSSQWEQAHVLSHPSILLVVSSLFFLLFENFLLIIFNNMNNKNGWENYFALHDARLSRFFLLLFAFILSFLPSFNQLQFYNYTFMCECKIVMTLGFFQSLGKLSI